ncbi:MAG: hypothetical protein KJ592_00940, partial [Nanoarchaeota archaeon]|nr:hypothetical protein [Nanoarchaeota archaeon]
MSNTLRLPVAGCRLPVLGKRGALGEWVVTLYRLLVVSFVAFIILGVSSVFYAHYIDVRDAEAVVMTRQVVDCVAPFGIVDMGVFSGDDKKGILSYCGFDDAEVGRFFVRVVVLEALPLERTSSSLEPSALEMKKVGE